VHADDIGRLIDREGVAVRVGHHCTQPLMERFNVPATVRASVALYSTCEEIDTLVHAVRKAVNVMSRTCPVERTEVRPSGEDIERTQDRIVQEFNAIPDWEERYQKIIELGKRHPSIPENLKDEKWIVRGCQSTVWLHPELKDGKIAFAAESNAMRLMCALRTIREVRGSISTFTRFNATMKSRFSASHRCSNGARCARRAVIPANDR